MGKRSRVIRILGLCLLFAMLLGTAFNPGKAFATPTIYACNTSLTGPYYTSSNDKVNLDYYIGCPSGVEIRVAVTLVLQQPNFPDVVLNSRHVGGVYILSAGTLSKSCSSSTSVNKYFGKATFKDQFGNSFSKKTPVVSIHHFCSTGLPV